MDLQTSHLEHREHARIIIYWEVFLYFFPNQSVQKINFSYLLFYLIRHQQNRFEHVKYAFSKKIER